MQPRPINIDSLSLIEMGDGFSWFEVMCGKGTYVRALARDMAIALGTKGHVKSLMRWAVGPYQFEDGVELIDICGPDPKNIERSEDLIEKAMVKIAPLESALKDIDGFAVRSDDAHRIRLGNAILMRGAGAPINSDLAYVHQGGQALALGFIDRGQFKPKRVILAH